jgi:hypothetical protein
MNKDTMLALGACLAVISMWYLLSEQGAKRKPRPVQIPVRKRPHLQLVWNRDAS